MLVKVSTFKSWKKTNKYLTINGPLFIIDSREKMSPEKKSLQIQAEIWKIILNPV